MTPRELAEISRITGSPKLILSFVVAVEGDVGFGCEGEPDLYR